MALSDLLNPKAQSAGEVRMFWPFQCRPNTCVGCPLCWPCCVKNCVAFTVVPLVMKICLYLLCTDLQWRSVKQHYCVVEGSVKPFFVALQCCFLHVQPVFCHLQGNYSYVWHGEVTVGCIFVLYVH